jgi:hypothetical protein
MGTIEHTVINPTRVSNAEGPTTAQIVSSKRTSRRNVPCAEGTPQLTTKAVNIITTLPKATTLTEPPPVNSAPSPTDTYVPTITQPSLPQQQRSYAEAVRNDTQQAEELLTAIKVFLEDFEGLFAQLLHKNSMILNMLSTILNNKHN